MFGTGPDTRGGFCRELDDPQATQDGVHQPDWVGVTLTITSVDATGGVYSLSSTPDLAIWPASGTWLVSDQPNLFIRGDILDVLYVGSADELTLLFLIPRHEPCAGPCLGIVYGQWEFKTTRD